ncbi:L-lactate dehydrogenase [Psychrobacter sp. SWN149]|uniref:L-lactate dehydrogenase n=1 Tax=Psychrobacter sp. SWN149 TaxID=2792057 RepID=UPI0018CD6728|nr:L-lactate dehydrogenase [Psychrobacter sp. SWN149]MBH0006714.1 L-lactate dehydrogenase [Psychrobacter sp. SWN149]
MSKYDVVAVTTNDYKRQAKQRLPNFLFDYIEGGANAEQTLQANTADFKRYTLRQRVMRDVSAVDTSTTLFGESLSMPLALAPVGMAGLFARRGEVQAARAAEKNGIPFTLSTVAICSSEEVQSATNQPFWFQLYMLRDRALVLDMLHRAAASGCKTLVFTVDLALPGMRLRDYRNGMLGGSTKGKMSYLAQLFMRPGWLLDIGILGKPHSLGNLKHKVESASDLDRYKAFVESQFDPSATWKDIAWLRNNWSGNIIIKGIMDADDAKAAVDAGADGIVVSNHDGRQLDGVSSTIDKLPSIANSIGQQTKVLLDGGIHNGVDVVKAIALGADSVLIGRSWVYAMAAQGEAGVNKLLTLYQQEIAATMGLMGVSRIEALNSDVIERFNQSLSNPLS